MQLRKLVLACGFASFALSNYASALGLGEVKLNSTLNQPLNAEIKLLETRDLSAEQILVALASPADFERNGVDRLYFYTELQFEVDLKHAGGPIVRVTTRNAVREPYLNFLVEARWTSGRLLREYTVLMDLPTFDSTAPSTVEAAQAAKPKPSNVRPAATAETSTPEPAAAAPGPSSDAFVSEEAPKKKSKVSAGTYGPIDKNDTLWEIAKEVRPDTSVTVHQTMMALQRLNPQSFIRGNINLLKRGQVLRVPDASEAADVSRGDAINQVATQTNQWSGAATATAESGAQLDASVSASNSGQKSEPVSGRVKLEAPAGDTAASGLGSGADKTGGSGIEAKLSSSLEELDKAKSENTELTSRVQELEDQIKTMQKLADASNEKMRALQLVAAKQAEDGAAIASAAADQASVAEPSIQAVSSDAVSSAEAVVAAAPAASSADNAVASSAAAKENVTATKTQTEKSVVQHIFDNLLWVIVALVGLVIALFLFLRGRKDDEETKSATDVDTFYAPEPTFERVADPVPLVPAPQLIPEEIPEAEPASVVAETDDVVSEAGIYISLGKYQQAEEMLVNALNTSNPSSDVYLKLLEVYSHTQNVAEFDKQYAALWPIATPIVLSRAAELRSAIHGVETYQAGVSSFDNVVGDESSSAVAHVAVDENINLTPRRYDLDFSDPKPAELNTDAEAEEEFVIDFDDNKKLHPEADDLSDIASALDNLDATSDEVIADDIDVARLNTTRNELGEISFEANDLEIDDSDVEKQNRSPLSVQDDGDFNLEMDMDNVDLAALEREMDGLDPETTDTHLIRSNGDPEALISDDDLAEFDALFDAEATVTDEDLASTFDVNDQAGDVLTLDDAIPYSPEQPLAEAETGVTTAPSAFKDDAVINFTDVETSDDVSLSDLDEQLQELDDSQAAEERAQAPYDENIDETVFNEAMFDFSAESLNADVEDMADEDVDAELDFMVDADEAATKLDLARAYLDMGDSDGARDILAEVAQEGTEQQREEAISMLSRIDS